MSTNNELVAEILADLSPLNVRSRAMFGGHTVYCDEKPVALICDDIFFLKPTAAVDTMRSELEACPPYPGARDCLILDDRFMQDRERFRSVVQATADLLTVPRRKKKAGAKAPRKSKGVDGAGEKAT